ncbi:thiol-disulfide isomerase/thioredoxin [Pedobacter sp. CAN_A7]|uniref:peroxiredoxin family protein n=1 Tax=Pedobacter sp. CAN_A7 TaxID=2787722 RepID=UPI0018CB8911
MYKNIGLFLAAALFTLTANAQSSLQTGSWNANLHREDGKKIVFNLAIEKENGKTRLYVVNEPEKMLVDDVRQVKDSLFINMPLFESSFKLKIISKDSLAGTWIKKGSLKTNEMPFTASSRVPYRFAPVKGDAQTQVEGKWKVDFQREGKTSPAIGNFKQTGNKVSGSILTPSGDYRFLSGIVTGDQLWISTFDGVYAMVFNATVSKDSLTNGKLYSGNSAVQSWSAKKDENATLQANTSLRLKDGEDGTLNFSFKDLNGNQVSILDEKYKNKVVIIQILGSWCPNCIDETAYLTEYYDKNKDRGVEVIGLAYEYTTDPERTNYSLGKLVKRFKVKYPILVAPVALSDPKKTEKTLPQLTEISVFPSTIILDKSGKVSSITSDFYGPGTGEYYTKYTNEFEQKINKLLEAK